MKRGIAWIGFGMALSAALFATTVMPTPATSAPTGPAYTATLLPTTFYGMSLSPRDEVTGDIEGSMGANAAVATIDTTGRVRVTRYSTQRSVATGINANG